MMTIVQIGLLFVIALIFAYMVQQGLISTNYLCKKQFVRKAIENNQLSLKRSANR